MQKKIILIVEDQPEIRRLITMTLDYGDYIFLEAKTCEESLLLINKIRPDMVLLDIITPGKLNGIQVCTVLRQAPATKWIPVVILSASGQEDDVLIALEAGCNAYLVKPFSPLKLIETVEYWFARNLTQQAV